MSIKLMRKKEFLTNCHVLQSNSDEDGYEKMEITEDEYENEAVSQENQNDFNKIFMFGEQNSGFRLRASSQNYSELLHHHLTNDILFEDENFPPESILLVEAGINKKDVVWKRPHEIVDNPEFIIDGTSRFDISQGNLGDCWFLASIAALTINQQLLEHIVPTDQNFNENYAGIFHFRFWQFGRWVDVVIDDRLPTIDGKLIYLKSTDPREFWTPLLEKAYAKVYGSYININGGHISEALEDMSGGLSEFYEIKREDISTIMLMSYERSSLMGCSILANEMEGIRSDGLVTMHAYSITKMVSLSVNNVATILVRLRNPWGDDNEWNGAWSDDSEHWFLIPKETRESLQRKEYDGEFWMELSDFREHFTYLDICHLNPTSFHFLSELDKSWNVFTFEGTWVPNVTAGGGLNFIETFANNPQYFVTIMGSFGDVNRNYAVVFGLMQKFRRALGLNNLPTELVVYEVPKSMKNAKLLNRNFFQMNEPLCYFKNPLGFRQLTGRLLLPPGRYCVIPCTEIPNLGGEYLLRIFSEVQGYMRESDEDVGYQTINDDVATHQAIARVSTTYQKKFKKFAEGDKKINCDDIRKVLNKIYSRKALICFIRPKKLFSKETCRNIVSLWNQDYSTSLDSEEFWKLMTDVTTLELIFKRFDQDNSGKLSGFELRNLLENCGYKVNKQILNTIMSRYGVNGSLAFENFVMCAIKLRAMIQEFDKKIDGNNHKNKEVSFSKEEWLAKTLSS